MNRLMVNLDYFSRVDFENVGFIDHSIITCCIEARYDLIQTSSWNCILWKALLILRLLNVVQMIILNVLH